MPIVILASFLSNMPHSVSVELFGPSFQISQRGLLDVLTFKSVTGPLTPLSFLIGYDFTYCYPARHDDFLHHFASPLK